MANGDDIEASSDSSGTNPLPTTGAATIDAPSFNQAGTELQLEQRSIKTVGQAWQICKTLEQNGRQRNLRTAEIQEIYDGAPPRSPSGQAEKAKSWMANFSSQWLAGIVDRQSQRFVNAIISQTYLSYSRLPDSQKDAKTKSDLMQSKFTRLIRSWKGYTGTINSLAVETVLQGYAYAIFLDPYTAWPKMMKQDRVYMPELAEMHASQLQFFAVKEDYRLDKFLDLFTPDTKVAEDTGYDIDNCEKAANEATMQDPREDATTTQYRKWADMVNEGTLGLSYTNTGERVVKVYLLFNREYDGQVSFWIIDRDNGRKLRFSPKLFKKMEHVLEVFSFTPGNGCIHSSKGLGRKLAALAIVKEIFRNSWVDNARIAMLMILQTSAKDRNKIAPQLLSPFIYIDKEIQIPETQFQGNSEPAKELDQASDNWSEQSVGAYLTSQGQDRTPDKTATQVTIEARREQEAADIQIRRWLDFYFGMTQIQQRRAFSDDNIEIAERIADDVRKDPTKDKPEIYEKHENVDPEILRTLVEILMDPLQIDADQIKIWRESPASVFAHVSDAVIAQGLAAVFLAYKGDPDVNQQALKAMDIENKVGAETAAKLIIPNPDQTIIAEATRQQLMEATSMATNLFPIPVSVRDNHLVHGTVLKGLLTAMGPRLSTDVKPDPKFMKEVEILYNHLAQHLQFASASVDNKSPIFADLEKFFTTFGKQLKQVIAIQAQAAAATKAVIARVSAEGIPGGAPGPVAQPAAPADSATAGATAPPPAPGTAEIPGEGTGEPEAAQAA